MSDSILIVFGVSGLWHGASWHFIAWGLIHAIFQIVGNLKKHIKKKMKMEVKDDIQESFSQKLGKGIITFVLVDFAWIFFCSRYCVSCLWYFEADADLISNNKYL